MCKTLIRRIVTIDNGKAKMNDGNYYQIFYDEAKVGDMVLVYANLAMRKISEREVKEIDGYQV